MNTKTQIYNGFPMQKLLAVCRVCLEWDRIYDHFCSILILRSCFLDTSSFEMTELEALLTFELGEEN